MSDIEPVVLPEAMSEALLRDCLQSFPHVNFRVTGDCMGPSLAPGDTVLISRPSLHAPRFGDVVLARLPNGLRLHRLVWGPPFALGRSLWRTKGDLAPLWDPPIDEASVLGTVIDVAGTSYAARPLWRTVTSLLGALCAHLCQVWPGADRA